MNSTWVIKQNSDYFPMMAIYSVLKAWYGDKPSGHWVVFWTEISGVKLLAIGYAWSNSSLSHFVSTCGSIMHPAKECYETHFKDDFGVITMTKTCLTSSFRKGV